MADKKYTTLINKTILETITDNKGATPNFLFDTIKCRVRGATVKYGSYKKKTDNIILQDWNKKLSELQEKLPHLTSAEDVYHTLGEIHLLTGRIEVALADITKGSAMRARVQHYEEGERCSKKIYNLEKSNYNKKTLNGLITDDGEIHNPIEILNR